MKDAQANFHIMRLSANSRLSHLLQTVPAPTTCHAAALYEALMEWALASIIAGDGATPAGLPTPEEIAHNPTVCQKQTYLGHEALRQAHLPIREGGLGPTSSSLVKGAAYIGCHALVLGRVVAPSARGNLLPLLERLRERSIVSSASEELKTMATEAKKSRIEVTGSPSDGREPSREGDRNSTGQSGSRTREGEGEGRGKRGVCGGGC